MLNLLHQDPNQDVVLGVHRPTQNPAALYLASLAPSGRRSQRHALDQVAEILSKGRRGALEIAWHELTYEHTSWVRAILVERYAASTARRMLAAVRGVLREARRLHLMTHDAYDRAVDLRAVPGRRLPAGRALAGTEVEQLIESCATDPRRARGLRDLAVLALCYGAGLRRTEAVHLDVAHWSNDTLQVLGKGSRERVVPLAGASALYLEAWLTLRGSGPGALLCPVTQQGEIQIRPMTPEALYQALNRRARLAGVQDLRPHDLRRTCATDLLDRGADLLTVRDLLGHASADTTAIYDRRGDEALKRAARLHPMPNREISAEIPPA